MKVLILIFLIKFSTILCDFTFPEIKFEAYKPKGLKVIFPEIEGVKQIGFHANKNKVISQVEPGEFNKDIINPKINGWFYFIPELKLQIGDKINYWIFLQHEILGYRKDGLEWEVKELLNLDNSLNENNCLSTITEVPGGVKVCSKHIIFESTFNSTIDSLKWKQAHYIPSEPDFEFCSYQKRPDVCFIQDEQLVIKPIAITDDKQVHGTLDLRDGCTSHLESDCIWNQSAGYYLPPVISGKIKTIRNFKYAKIEVRAKLPIGDWIVPEFYLQSANNKNKKIWMAYARGNEQLIGNDGDDLGGKILFGGPVLDTQEPERSKYLSSHKINKHFGNDFHKYSLIWEPNKISMYIDDVLYGESTSVASNFNEHMHLVLGVKIGGVPDFPDNYVSTNNKKKPWKNLEIFQNKLFYTARNDWLPTWNKESSLKVEYVKIWAL